MRRLFYNKLLCTVLSNKKKKFTMKHCPQLKKCLKNPTVLLKNTNKLSNYSKSEIIMKLNFTKREKKNCANCSFANNLIYIYLLKEYLILR